MTKELFERVKKRISRHIEYGPKNLSPAEEWGYLKFLIEREIELYNSKP